MAPVSLLVLSFSAWGSRWVWQWWPHFADSNNLFAAVVVTVVFITLQVLLSLLVIFSFSMEAAAGEGGTEEHTLPTATLFLSSLSPYMISKIHLLLSWSFLLPQHGGSRGQRRSRQAIFLLSLLPYITSQVCLSLSFLWMEAAWSEGDRDERNLQQQGKGELNWGCCWWTKILPLGWHSWQHNLPSF